MKRLSQKVTLLPALLLVAICAVQCSKKKADEPAPVIVKTEVTSFSPLRGFGYGAVTITGTGFDTARANTSVKFNGIAANIRSITDTKVVAEVPYNATTGKIVFVTKSTTFTSPTDFIINSYTESKIPATGVLPGNAIANIAADAAGFVYCNTGTDTVFKISPTGVKTTMAIAGNGNTKLGGIAVDGSGNVYGVGTNDFKVYKITAAGAVSVLAGSGISGSADGQGAAAQFTAPAGIAVDATGNLFVTDVYRVRKVTPAGLVSTIAGGAVAGNADGQGAAATFGKYGNLQNITTDAAGNIYLADGDAGTYYGPNNAFFIRLISPAGAVNTIGPIPVQRSGYIVSPAPFTKLFELDANYLYMPGTSYSTGTNASAGCCTIGPMYFVNKTLDNSYIYDITTNIIAAVAIKFTSVAKDPAGNIYTSAAITPGNDYIFKKNGTPGSVILKITVK